MLILNLQKATAMVLLVQMVQENPLSWKYLLAKLNQAKVKSLLHQGKGFLF